MSNLSDRVSYLRGLAEGLKVDEASNEGQLITELIKVLSDVVEEVDDLREEVDELNDYVESIDEDLSDLEEVFGDDDEFDDDFDDDDFDDDDDDFDDDDDDDDDELGLYVRGGDIDADDEDDDDDEASDMYLGCICPDCHGMFCIDASTDGDVELYTCPHCGEAVAAVPLQDGNVPIAKAFTEGEDI